MNYPVGNLKFSTRTSSFIEDWLETGYNNREIHHKNGWKRQTSNTSWLQFTSTYFDKVDPDPRAANYANNYDGGAVNNEYFFMSSGGSASPETNTFRTMLHLPITGSNPGYPPGVYNNWNFTLDNKILNHTWEISTSQSPQFSYHMKVFNNPNLAGSPLMEIDSIKPHARAHPLDVSQLPDGAYYVQFFITDIFDNVTPSEVKSFTLGELVSTSTTHNEKLSLFPNPFSNALTVKTNQLEGAQLVTIKDIERRVVLQQTINNTTTLTPEVTKGIYFVTIKGNKTEKTFKVIKR